MVIRVPTTCGSKQITDSKEAPEHTTYEWEFSGVNTAATASLFSGELGMLSVITDNYQMLEATNMTVTEAFGNLAEFLRKFLDSRKLAN